VACLPASFIQQAPSGQEGKVFASYEQLQGYQPDYFHAPSLAAKPGAGATHTPRAVQTVAALQHSGSALQQSSSNPHAVYAVQSFHALTEEAGMHKRFAAEQLDFACDDATMITSMFVDHSCFQQATSWMRQYVATTAGHAARWWSPTSTKPTFLPLSTS
jgi:hypothetical protein